MGHDHHHHHHHDTQRVSDGGLIVAIVLNMLLTVVELVAGILAGSLALIGDAIHNGSDAVSLVVALVARRWSRRQPDAVRTYGYRRASVIGALINLTTLVVIGIYLLYEAVMRFIEPTEIHGWIMISVATVAVVVDLGTVFLMKAMGSGLNIRAALAHNLADALASVAVIIAGVVILFGGPSWIDPALTAFIALYILIHSWGMLAESIAILMDSVPTHAAPDRIAAAMCASAGVHGVHHLHLRRLDEAYLLLEAHVVVDHTDAETLHQLKADMRKRLHDEFHVEHATLDFEFYGVERDHSDRLIATGH